MSEGWPEKPDWPEPWPKMPTNEDGITCPKCKMSFKGITGYYCPDSNCPIQTKVVFE